MIDVSYKIHFEPSTINVVRKALGLVEKTQAHPKTLHLRVQGMSRTPDGQLTYRMVSKDGHYVGRTNPSKVRAKKGDTLKVQAQDFLQDAMGDVHWINPDVVSGVSDAPHSWRELCAMAGGDVEKDMAEGAAGDAPPAGDVGVAAYGLHSNGDIAALAATSANAMSDVHVNVPLKTISLAYGVKGKKLKYQVHKADEMKQIAYGTVLEPNSLDSQDDFMLPEHVEKTAHGYLKKAIRGKGSVSKLQHTKQGFMKNKPSICPVESFIAPMDFSYDGKEVIKKGSWVMAMHIEDPHLWNDFLDGKYTGFSVGGTGIRRKANSMPNEMEMPYGEYRPPASGWPEIQF